MSKRLNYVFTAFIAAIISAVSILSTNTAFVKAEGTEAKLDPATASVEEIMAAMSLDDKISQMIIPAFRTWNGNPVTDLSKVPELAEALKKHQYGGVMLYGVNISSTEQITKLVSDLQVNNAANENVSVNIPYLMPLDQEGGRVTRLATGTRMTGNMGIGATGADAGVNAFTTGNIIGEELAAIGFNTDFAPVIDVNNNPSNPVIGVRSFSDDPIKVAELGVSFKDGLAMSNIAATFKHFPGHGDTNVDSHIGTPSMNKTYDELQATEFVPFKTAIENGADIIMTAHITYPLIDDVQTFADGTTGFYPATMSKKMITEILRGDLGFDGVVVTDALEMDGIKAGLVPGEKGTPEYSANIAEKVINAGTDILLLPKDMNSPEIAAFYDTYIDLLCAKIEDGTISIDRINESVKRILELKKKYKITETDTTGKNIEQKIANAEAVVGCDEHHDKEFDIATEAVTLVKNDDLTLPVSGYDTNIVIIGRNELESLTFLYAISLLQKKGIIDENARIINYGLDTAYGSESSGTKITLDYYYDTSSASVHYTDELQAAIEEADRIIVIGQMSSLSNLAEQTPQYSAISASISDAHAAGSKVIYLSDHLPYDAARYQEADAVMISYLASGLDLDPTERTSDNTMYAYNANVVAALMSMFDNTNPSGTLPVNIPSLTETDEGLAYTDENLYVRGHGLGYTYAFTEGAESVYDKGSDTKELVFKNNARGDLLVRLLVDGNDVSLDYASKPGFTTIQLPADYLKTLSLGDHVLSAVYSRDSGDFSVDTSFKIKGEVPAESTEQTESSEQTELNEQTLISEQAESTNTPNTSKQQSGTNSHTNPTAAAAKNGVQTKKVSGEVISGAANTGDNHTLLIWSVLAATAAGVIITTIVFRKRRS